MDRLSLAMIVFLAVIASVTILGVFRVLDQSSIEKILITILSIIAALMGMRLGVEMALKTQRS